MAGIEGPIRFATFNASLNRSAAGQLTTDLSTPDNVQAKTIAEIIQRTNPDVLLVNEFDFDAGQAADLQDNYLATSQKGVDPVEYPYRYVAPSNTGIPSELDLNNDGSVGGPDDAWGFGFFPGQYGMVLYSKYPIDTANVRTFQNFLWQDMPGALLPDDPNTPAPGDWYSPAELAAFRLSSKSHWDIPIQVNGEVIHVLASHPTPPAFDGPEDRNGRRNHDEIRFWDDYITPGQGSYIYDDAGNFGGLSAGARFVIMGDQNADPQDGDSTDSAILQLLNNPLINTSVTPDSEGGPDAAARQGGTNGAHEGDPAFDTADFDDRLSANGPGNLRVDYVLPSQNLEIADAGVFWPPSDDPLFPLVGNFDPDLPPPNFPSSDHRLVRVDVGAEPTIPDVSRKTVTNVDLLGEVKFDTGLIFDNTVVGGLSGITYDPFNKVYYSISDDRSQINPARFYTLDINLTDSTLDSGDIKFQDVTTLTDANGDPFAPASLDPEGIALTDRGTLFISSEGDASQLINPFVNQFSLQGQQFQALPVPAKFLPTADGTSGVRNNLALESLTISPDNRFLYTATENALIQDGPAADIDSQSPSRIVQYNLLTGQPEQELVYFTDPVAAESVPPDEFENNGLVDLLAIDNSGTLLALERSFAVGVGNSIKLYEVQTQGALDVSDQDSLINPDTGAPLEIDPAAEKRLLLDFDQLELPLDNIEGVTFGPTLPDGRQSLIVVSDNNFNVGDPNDPSDNQFTQFLALALDTDTIPVVTPTVETPQVIDDDQSLPTGAIPGDADDPAIYVHPTDASQSLVISSLKDGGLATYDLNGQLAQSILPAFGEIRYNNVDLVYGFDLGDQSVDLAVASDREDDTLAIFQIDPTTRQLTDVTADTITESIFGVDDGEQTAYGLATYTSPVSGTVYVFVSQRESNQVAQLELVANATGQVDAKLVRTLTVPIPDGGELEDAQVEGMVADRELGFLYVGQEKGGIYKFAAEPNGGDTGVLIEAAKPDGSRLEADVEGLTIYYAEDGKGYLLASSQGNSTFAAYERGGNNQFLGSFVVGETGGIDAVEESDGADVINVPLGSQFPSGLLVVQDGANQPQVVVQDDEQLENISTNFKFVPWEGVANAFADQLAIDTSSFNPRNLEPTKLKGFAQLPADTFAKGPPAGQDLPPDTTNGRPVPFPGQPIQGFSGVQFADQNAYWFLSDNGFGRKENSADYLLRIHRLDPNFKGAEEGSGNVEVIDFIQLSDPDRKIPFAIQNEDTTKRLLTGADFDIESFVIAADDTFWVGEEFGPFLLHFDSTGKLLEAPIPTPNLGMGDVRSPQNPFLVDPEAANLERSKGFEGMAISPDKTKLYPLLEGPVTGDPDNALRIYEFDVASKAFTGLAGFYRLEDPSHAIGDFTVINENEYLVIERDPGQADTAQFKKVFKIDLSQKDTEGFVAKEPVADLLKVSDLHDLNGDGKQTFDFPFETIEDVLVIDEQTILVANDNNYPFSLGRPPAIDNNEILLLELEEPLDVDPRVGFDALSRNIIQGSSDNETLVGPDDTDDFIFASAGNDTVAGGLGNDQIFGEAGDDLLRGDLNRRFSSDSGGDDTIHGGAGNDGLGGKAGNDSLYGEEGDDQIWGDQGDDKIYGGTGNDQVRGGRGSDTFVLAAGEGTDTIGDFQSSQDDRIGLAQGLRFEQLTITQSSNNTLIGFDDETLAILTGITVNTLNSSSFTSI